MIAHFGSVTSNIYLYVNGQFAGYAEDSKVAAEFDITPFLKKGKNLIAFQTFRWCDGSWCEDQDFWRLSGVARENYLYARDAHLQLEDIRNMVLDRDEELSQGDILMIVKNNYYWMEEERKKLSEERRVKSEETAFGGRRESQFNCLANHKVQSSKFKVQSKEVQSKELPAFLANGDRAKVLRVRRRIDLYGFHFATLLLQFPDYDNYELEATVLLDTLTSEAPALTHEQQEQLFRQIEEDYQVDQTKHID